MTEGITCYEQDETLCEDGMCLRCGCRLRNDRLSAQQREPVLRVKELEWEDADEGMCTKWRACALGGHYELVALDGDGGGLAVNFYWGRPLSFWFIQGEPDEWGPTGPKMFPTLEAAKAAAQADFEQRIRSAIEIVARISTVEPTAHNSLDAGSSPAAPTTSDGGSPGPSPLAVEQTSSDPASGRSQPSPDVSVDELAEFIRSLDILSFSAEWHDEEYDAARALLASHRIERLDRLASSGRR